MNDSTVVAVVALVMALGVAGTVVPLVPGLGLVVAGAVLYGLSEGFGGVGVVAMVVIVALAVGGTVAGLVLPGRAAGRAGATRGSLALGLVGAVVGFFAVPVVGLPLGGALGVYLGELMRTRDRRTARTSTWATLRSFGVSTLVQFVAGMVMVLVWAGWVLAV